jgi:CRISP-associated protein Cas1
VSHGLGASGDTREVEQVTNWRSNRDCGRQTARKAVEKRKREVQRFKDDLQEIVITKPGTYLGRTGERLLIRREGKREAEIPLQAIRNISMLTTAGSMSAELLVAAAARGISIHLIGSDGRPLVRIGPPDAPLFQLSAAQARIAESAEGLNLAREFVRGKIRNQGNLLRYFGKHKDRRGGKRAGEETVRALETMEQVSRSLEHRTFGADLDLERNQLFGAEAQAAVAYWKAVRALLWQNVGFTGRVHQGAADPVNAALNYGYGILYSRLMSVLVRTGLNPSIGFLHKPRPGKAPLLYDFIEEFRAGAVDRVVFSFLNLGKTLAMADGRLESEARQELARAVLHRLQANTRYHGETATLLTVMEAQARLLVRHLEGKEPYESYILPW